MIRAHIIPSSNRKPKSRDPIINSIPMNPKQNPDMTENTNCATAINCRLICLTEILNLKYCCQVTKNFLL